MHTKHKMRLLLLLLLALVVAGAEEVVVSLLGDRKEQQEHGSLLNTMQTSSGAKFDCYAQAKPAATEEETAEFVIRDMLAQPPLPCVTSRLDAEMNYWQYKVCFNDTVHQVRMEAGREVNSILLGRFDGQQGAEATTRYLNGDSNRSVELKFVCGESENFEIKSATEYAPLQYSLEIGLKRLCQVKESLDSLSCFQRKLGIQVGFNETTNATIVEYRVYKVCPHTAVYATITKELEKVGQFKERVVRPNRVIEYFTNDHPRCSSKEVGFETRVVYQCAKDAFIPTLISANQDECELVLHVKLNQVCDAQREEIACLLAVA